MNHKMIILKVKSISFSGYELRYTLLSYPSAFFWAKLRAAMDSSKLCCTLWATEPRCALLSCAAAKIRPPEKRCTLLIYAAPLRTRMLHPPELCCTLLSWVASLWATLLELGCTLLSLAAHLWATLHPPELRCNLLSYAVPFWATILCAHWETLYFTELGYTKLSYVAPNWAALQSVELRYTVQAFNLAGRSL